MIESNLANFAEFAGVLMPSNRMKTEAFALITFAPGRSTIYLIKAQSLIKI
jgi:hypothetical protein